MMSTKVTAKRVKKEAPQEGGLVPLNRALMAYMLTSSTQTRESLLRSLLNPNLDIDYECGYPDTVDIDDYKQMWDKEGLAKRVVTLMPEECWTQHPKIFETEGADKTKFELAWDKLQETKNVLSYLKRVDIASGIGTFGILLLGLSDGKTLDRPVEGINSRTGLPLSKKPGKPLELLYLKSFDESVVTIAEKETDPGNPRFGYPISYTIQFDESSSTGRMMRSKTVHWTRVMHVADNRECSEVIGVPRMKPVYHRLLDIRKILSGSAEMFWKGGFPGLSFEAMPDALDATIDTESIKAQVEKYFKGLQRYLAIQGVNAKSLAPQVADPKPHLEAQLMIICLTLGVPLRVFLGSEEGKLASTQDKRTWSERVMERRLSYVTPMIIRGCVDLLIRCRVLPPVERYFVDWPDRAAVSDRDMADVARIRAEAMKNYMQGECYEIMSFRDYLVRELKYSAEEAEEIINSANESKEEMESKKIDEEERQMELEVQKAKEIAKSRPAPDLRTM